MAKTIIGITGTFAAGKDTIAEILKNYGFESVTMSLPIRRYCQKNKIKETRENLQKIANQWRKKYGPNYLMKKTIELVWGPKVIITGIRNLAEIDELKKKAEKSLILGVDAPIKARYQRIKSRMRTDDKNVLNFKEFKQSEDKEKSNQKSAQQIDKCLQKADEIIINDSTKSALNLKIKQLIKKYDQIFTS